MQNQLKKKCTSKPDLTMSSTWESFVKHFAKDGKDRPNIMANKIPVANPVWKYQLHFVKNFVWTDKYWILKKSQEKWKDSMI